MGRPAGGRHLQPVPRRHGRARAGRPAPRVFDAPPELDDVEAAAFTLPFHVGYLALQPAGGAAGRRAPARGRRRQRGGHRGHPARRGGRRRRDGGRRRAGEGGAVHHARRVARHRPHDRRRLRPGDGRRPTATAPTSSSTSSAATAPRRSGPPIAQGGRYLPVGFNDDPQSGLTGRPLRRVSMGNFSVVGVILAYMDVPIEFRRFGVNPFPPSVGREVHAELLELVAAGAHPAGGRPAHRHGRGGRRARGPRGTPHQRPHRRRPVARLTVHRF